MAVLQSIIPIGFMVGLILVLVKEMKGPGIHRLPLALGACSIALIGGFSIASASSLSADLGFHKLWVGFALSIAPFILFGMLSSWLKKPSG